MKPVTRRVRSQLARVNGLVPTGVKMPLGNNWTGGPVLTKYDKMGSDELIDEIGGSRPKDGRNQFRPLARMVDQSGLWYVTYPIHNVEVLLGERVVPEEYRVYMDVIRKPSQYKPTEWTTGYAYFPRQAVECPKPFTGDHYNDYVRARFDAYLALTRGITASQQNVLRAACEFKDTRKMGEEGLQFALWVRKSVQSGTLKKFTPISVAAKLYLTMIFGILPTVRELKTFRAECKKGCYRFGGTKVDVKKAGSTESKTFRTRLWYPGGFQFPNCPAIQDFISGRAYDFDVDGVDHVGGFLFPNNVYEKPVTHIRTSDIGRYADSLNMPVYYEEKYVGKVFGRWIQDIRIDREHELLTRLRWSNPFLASAWELLPCSFVANWVVDISSTLLRLERAFTTARYLSYLENMSLTTRVERSVSVPRITDLSTYTIQHNSWNYARDTPLYWRYQLQQVTLRTLLYRGQQSNFYVAGPGSVASVSRGNYLGDDAQDPVVWAPTLNLHIKSYQASSLMAMLASSART